MDYDIHGQMFYSNNVNNHLWHVIPGAHYETSPAHFSPDFAHVYGTLDPCADHYHWDQHDEWWESRSGKRHDTSGGGHSHVGGMIYLGDNWPPEYRGDFYTCNTHGHRINRDRLERHGSGYTGRHMSDFMMSNSVWFRGIELKYGPDGGVFVLDWTEKGECHDTDGVHRTSGRIFKVTHGSVSPPHIKDVSTLEDEELVLLHAHENEWYVRTARRLLHERHLGGRDLSRASKALIKMFNRGTSSRRIMAAMFTLFTIDGVDGRWLEKQLAHRSEHVRVWAIRMLVDEKKPSPAIIKKFNQMAKSDSSMLVRLFLASALQRIPLDARLSIAQKLARREMDKNLALMIWYGIEKASIEHPDEAIQFALSTPSPVLRQNIARRMADDYDREQCPVQKIVAHVEEERPRSVNYDLLSGMARALRGRRNVPMPRAWPGVVVHLTGVKDPLLQQTLRELSLSFGSKEAIEELRQIVSNRENPVTLRRNAMELLVDSPEEDLLPFFLGLLDDPDLADLAVRALAHHDRDGIAEKLIALYSGSDAAVKQEIIATLSARPSSALKLLAAVEAGDIAGRDIAAFQVRKMLAFKNEELTARLKSSWGSVRETPEEKRASIKQFKQRITPDHIRRADPTNGRAVYQKICASCHTLFGEGGKIGPDITGADRGNLDYLLENIIDPGATVSGNYRLTNILLKNGQLISGTIVEKKTSTLSVQTPQKLVVIERGEIDKLQPTELSLMPEGLLNNLSIQDARDLISYMMQGK